MDQDVHIRSTQILSQARAVTKNVTFDYRAADGERILGTREVYDLGDAAAVLPFDAARGTVLLTRQLRLPAWLNGCRQPLIEVCAGRLDGLDAQTRILREAEEELGYRLHNLEMVFDVFMSPGHLTERVACYFAAYSPDDHIARGGGLAEEGESIEVLDIPLKRAFDMIGAGAIIDAKTIMLIQRAWLDLAEP